MMMMAATAGLRRCSPLWLAASGRTSIRVLSAVAAPRQGDLFAVRPNRVDVELAVRLHGNDTRETVFHVAPTLALRDLIADMRDEDRNSIKKITFERPDGKPLDAASAVVADLIRGDFVASVDGRRIVSDRSAVAPYVAERQKVLQEAMIQYNEMNARKELCDVRAARKHLAFRLGVGGYLLAQLGGVVYLTYDIGWDIMEPTTYLMGLAVSVASLGIYMVTKRDYEYGVHFERLGEWLRRRAYRRADVDIAQLNGLLSKVRHMTTEVALLSDVQDAQARRFR